MTQNQEIQSVYWNLIEPQSLTVPPNAQMLQGKGISILLEARLKPHLSPDKKKRLIKIQFDRNYVAWKLEGFLRKTLAGISDKDMIALLDELIETLMNRR